MQLINRRDIRGSPFNCGILIIIRYTYVIMGEMRNQKKNPTPKPEVGKII